MEFLGKIGIEPKLVFAQIINFLVLVFILRFIVYKPILAIFKKRSELVKKLEQDLTDIEKKKKEAEATYQAKILDGQSRADEIIRKGRRTAEIFGEDTSEKNREYLDQTLKETKERIEGAKSELAKLSRQTSRDEASRLTMRFLTEKLQRELHEKLVGDALRNLEELGGREEDIAFKGTVTVLTAFALPRGILNQCKHLLQQKFGKKIVCVIEIEPGLKAGLIIRWGGYELDGSLHGQLSQLQKI
ncbi:MAG: F0F1 ATP synthase subunit delta [bacterium]|nr:F0F1 ATP synthase subunit delta [bacterium]